MRLAERFRARGDDFDFARVFDLLLDFVAADRRDFVAFPADPARALRCLALDFVLRPRLRDDFEMAFDFFTTLRTVRLAAGGTIGCPFSAALPITAPTTPPTTAPIGPATLPAAAPATAPAVCFRIGGIWIFLDDCESFSFFEFALLGINLGLLLVSRRT